jgi:hypothetical protein
MKFLKSAKSLDPFGVYATTGIYFLLSVPILFTGAVVITSYLVIVIVIIVLLMVAVIGEAIKADPTEENILSSPVIQMALNNMKSSLEKQVREGLYDKYVIKINPVYIKRLYKVKHNNKQAYNDLRARVEFIVITHKDRMVHNEIVVVWDT